MYERRREIKGEKMWEGEETMLWESIINYSAGPVFKIKDEIHNSRAAYKLEYVN